MTGVLLAIGAPAPAHAALLAIGAPAPAPAAPAPAAPAPTSSVDVIEVSGRIDPIVADFVVDSLRAAERDHSEALVIQVDSPGDLLSTGQLNVLTATLAGASVPVAVWVGAPGSRAYGGAARIADVAGVVGIAPGSHIGQCPSCRVRAGLRTTRSLSAGQAV
ncbi:MAG: hypothetical protein JO085_08190, partial [Acidimicrobiia bacterium]|nr:hypothetical protein [Acidimicrobiia bacterium]